MKSLLIMGIIVLCTNVSLAASAYRDRHTDYREYFNLHKVIHTNSAAGDEGDVDMVLDVTKNLNQFNWEQVKADMSTTSQTFELFAFLRDNKYFVDQPHFKRRISWLYPDDGCHARSALMQNLVQQKTSLTLQQIFVFGNLELKTPYSSKGVVTWWFHVAPLIKTEKGFYVLDPSVEAKEPLPLQSWLTRINVGNSSRVAICGAHAYVPESSCLKEDTDHTDEARQEERDFYLELEWNRIKNLKLNPEELLGDNPPWKEGNHWGTFTKIRP